MSTLDNIEKMLASLSPEKAAGLMGDLEDLITGSRKKASVKRSQSPSALPIRVRINNTNMVVRRSEVLHHFAELHMRGFTTVSPAQIKSDFVGICEMLAMLEEDEEERMRWRSQAAKIVMIDNPDTLIHYMTTIALGIKSS
jgi:hypothetical protein